jgi:hypothetical protein
LPSKTTSQILDAIKALETKFQAFLDASAKDRPLVNADKQPAIELENTVDDQDHNASHEACSRPVSPGSDDSGRNGSSETEPRNPLSPSESVDPTSRSYSMPYSVPLRHPSSPSKIVEAKSSFKISGKSYKDPTAIALCPQGQHVGYLFPDRIIVYNLDASKGEVGPPVFVELDSRVRWKCLQLAGPYLVAWGSLSSQLAVRSVSYLACRIQNNVITLLSSNYGTSRGHRILTPLSK